MEIKSKDGVSSSVPAKSLKFKLKGGKGSKSLQGSSQVLMQAQESEEEYEEESNEEDEEEGEIMIISSPRPTHTQGPSIQETPFLNDIDNDVDSFSTVFTFTIFVSKVNMSAFPISLTAPPILTSNQSENLGNLLEDFSTVMEGQVSQLDTSMAGFELFMIESSLQAPMNSFVQTEACTITT